MESSGDEEGSGLLSNFIFGNIDEDGQLETDFIDDDAKKSLSQLANFGIAQSLVRDIGSDSSSKQEDVSFNDFQQQKAQNSIDYSGIDELADEVEHEFAKPLPLNLMSKSSSSSTRSEDDDYDEEGSSSDGKSPGPSGLQQASTSGFNLPSVAPKAETMASNQETNVDELFSPSSPTPKSVTDTSTEENEGTNQRLSVDDRRMSVEEEKPPVTGLASLEGKTVSDLFPDFRPGKVLRFSRLFGPKKYVSAQWKGLKKKKRKRKLASVDANTSKPTGFELRFGPTPKPEDCQPDETIIHTQPLPLWAYGEQYQSMLIRPENDDSSQTDDNESPSWLEGPAQYWYTKHQDLIQKGKFNYGFKKKTEEQKLEEEKKKQAAETIPADQFNLVCLKQWEDDIIWSSKDYQPKENSEALRSLAGWIPSLNTRTMKAYLQQCANKNKASAEALASTNIMKNFEKVLPTLNKDPNSHKVSDWYSIFPIENKELIYGRWEDKIIWDTDAVDSIPSPQEFRLDPNDENLILSVPEDKLVKDTGVTEQTPKKEYKSKSRFMNKKDKHQHEHEEVLTGGKPKNRFNLSNDEYYMPKQDLAENQIQADLSSLCIQHSTPAVELQRPFFPTYFTPAELRTLHRPPLSKRKLTAKRGLQVIHSCHKRLKKKAKEREKERQAFGGGEMFFMRQPEDLSGQDGDLVFMEYCEELPPLVCQAGMNTRIRNYYKRKHGKDSNTPTLEYGEMAFIHPSTFLGQLAPGQVLQAIENNLFRAPIYGHKTATSDFLMFKTPQGFNVRKVQDIFTVGQLCPKYEVHGPNSKRANNHIRDFLQMFIYRLFLKCPDTPRRIKMEDIRKAFPKHSESTVRKRLKLCADFRRTGVDCNWWVLKSDFRLPSEEEMRAMVTPEQTCAYYQMLAAEQRLKDAGYGEKSLFAPDDDDNEADAKKVDEEIQTAPWNTTRAYIQAMKGKCLLQVTGVADPTGCGEGFSYIRIPNKPITKDETEEQKQAKKQKLVTGTDADLRRLNLKQARLLLKDFGVSQEEIEKLSRWDVIDKVRTMSTAAAKQGTTEVAMNKFARGSRFTVAEHQEKYKDECQRIFDLQNRVLSSDAILSSDEESSGEEGSDIEDLGKDLESMLSNKKISSEEHEEEERRELQKLLSQDKSEKDTKVATSTPKLNAPPEKEDTTPIFEPGVGKRLMIHRTFNEGGREFVRTETVKNPNVIEAYLRIVTRDKNYREVFASQDEKHKEDMRRERRRIQEQLRRIKRNEERERLRQLQENIKSGDSTELPSAEDQAKLDALSDKPTKVMRCGACGDFGHMKTNKMCPKYTEATNYTSPDDDFNTDEMSQLSSQDNLIKVEGTKITLGKALLEAHEDMKRKSLTIRIPKDSVIPVATPPVKKKRRPTTSTQTDADYLVRHHKSKNRRRTNPVVAFNVVLENIVTKLKEAPDSWAFHAPVSAKLVPDYYNIVKNPMDLQTIKENINKGIYHTRDDFLEHVSLIMNNCLLYNGQHHPLTKVAENLVNLAREELKAKEKDLCEIEREINPLLDEDPQVGLTFIFCEVLSSLKAIPESWPFHQPVPVKIVPDYYTVIKSPMDLETLKQRCQQHLYPNRERFMSDVTLLYTNSLSYNGAEHAFTKTAEKLTKVCEEHLAQHDEKLSQLENDLLHGPLDDGSGVNTNPPSVGAMSDIAEEPSEQSMFHYNSDPFNLNSLEANQVQAGNEDEFIDVEGDESMLQQYAQQQQQQQQDGLVQPDAGDFSQVFQQIGEDGDGELAVGGMVEGGGYTAAGMEEYQYTGGAEFDGPENFDDFQSDFFPTTMEGGESGRPGGGASTAGGNVGNIVDLLLQDLVHSDEDDEDESDDDIPLDDGDDDIPLDDGEEEDFEMDDDTRDMTRDDDVTRDEEEDQSQQDMDGSNEQMGDADEENNVSGEQQDESLEQPVLSDEEEDVDFEDVAESGW
ncbi:transcription initiation factor TFIID subunit 1-like isoform X2 [Clytia hemisphaerica]|uniref:Transcription initiation factor TFIID subunit 1 n=1 Tax=Clytia hemisphaerica TaxID=252671 RepID=A0A7M5XBK7_9CNID